MWPVRGTLESKRVDNRMTATQIPLIRRFTIERFRGIRQLDWRPASRLNVILGGGDCGKTTILEAIALLLNPTNYALLSDIDYWERRVEEGFCIEAVMSLPDSCLINHQTKIAWPWEWNGAEAVLPNQDAEASTPATVESVYRVRVRGTAEFDLAYEVVQPDGTADHFSASVRRQIGLVRLGGNDRNDRDLRLLQGSALDRLLSDRALRSRLSQKLAGANIDSELKDEAQTALANLSKTFEQKHLPNGLSIGLIGGQGFSVAAMIGLVASKQGVNLPLTAWGAGTRRLAALEIAASHNTENPITVVDEVERGLEPYRQRKLITDLQALPSQTFLTTHSSAVIASSKKAALWFIDSRGVIGALTEAVASIQERDPGVFLARLAVIAEGATEVGFVSAFLRRALGAELLDLGISVCDGQGNDQTLQVLEGMLSSGLTIAGFADDEGRNPARWAAVKTRLGGLLLRWPSGCLEENVITLVEEQQLEAFIKPPDGASGNRLRTLADRLATADKEFETLRTTANDLKALVIQAATGSADGINKNCMSSPKELKAHGRTWFKSLEGGHELEEKVFDFGLWPGLKSQLLPFANAVRSALRLPPVIDVQ